MQQTRRQYDGMGTAVTAGIKNWSRLHDDSEIKCRHSGTYLWGFSWKTFLGKEKQNNNTVIEEEKRTKESVYSMS